jgi:hypothetical protein
MQADVYSSQTAGMTFPGSFIVAKRSGALKTRSSQQSQEQLKTFDAKIEENAQKPEYARKVE